MFLIKCKHNCRLYNNQYSITFIYIYIDIVYGWINTFKSGIIWLRDPWRTQDYFNVGAEAGPYVFLWNKKHILHLKKLKPPVK